MIFLIRRVDWVQCNDLKAVEEFMVSHNIRRARSPEMEMGKGAQPKGSGSGIVPRATALIGIWDMCFLCVKG